MTEILLGIAIFGYLLINVFKITFDSNPVVRRDAERNTILCLIGMAVLTV